MELKLQPHKKNTHPLLAILIRGSGVEFWLQEIKRLRFDTSEIRMFPVPDITPNSIYGCVVVGIQLGHGDFQSVEKLQMVNGKILIPEFSILQPLLSHKDADDLFRENLHLMHPAVGLVELSAPLQIQDHIQTPALKSYYARQPLKKEVYPERILAFQIKPVAKEEIFNALKEKDSDESTSSTQKKIEEGPLSTGEKLKLEGLKLFFGNNENQGQSDLDSKGLSLMGKVIAKLGGLFGEKLDNMMDSLHQDMKDLEFRNKKKVDQLMDMLKNDPDEALKYAIPLDNSGTSRGGNNGLFSLNERWSSIDLFGRSSSMGSGRGSVQIGDHFQKLRQQYHEMALNFMKRKEFLKAAFVYLNLLGDYSNATRILEENGFYSEAATIYLEHVKNKNKAAECYEKGKIYDEAIKLYKELNLFEKTGDLLLKVHRRAEANEYYQKEIDNQIKTRRYLSASKIFQFKMNDQTGAKSCLLTGWRNQADPKDCLLNYLQFFDKKEDFENALDYVFKNEVTPYNQTTYLGILEHSFKNHKNKQELIRSQAYEIIARSLHKDKKLIHKLELFNPTDKQIFKDTGRFLRQS